MVETFIANNTDPLNTSEMDYKEPSGLLICLSTKTADLMTYLQFNMKSSGGMWCTAEQVMFRSVRYINDRYSRQSMLGLSRPFPDTDVTLFYQGTFFTIFTVKLSLSKSVYLPIYVLYLPYSVSTCHRIHQVIF